MWTDIALIVVSGVGSAAVAIALVYSARQAKTLQAQLAHQLAQADESATAQRAANDLKLMEQVMALDRIFIEMPELRGFFYDGLDLPHDEIERARVMSTAELVIDLADTVASLIRHGQLDEEDKRSWSAALQAYGRSPAVRSMARQGEGAWRNSTLALLRGAQTNEQPHVDGSLSG